MWHWLDTEAPDAEGGVVDHEGRVFSGQQGTAVHEGLYVCDGAVIHGHHLPPSLQTADSSGTVTRVSRQQATAERMNVYLDDRFAFSLSVPSTLTRPRSIRPVTTVPRPLMPKTSSIGIKNGRSTARSGVCT